MATRTDGFWDSNLLPWWEASTSNLNVAVTFGETSPINGSLATTYSVDPLGVDWGFVDVRSRYSMDRLGDCTVDGTIFLNAGESGGAAHGVQVGLVDPSNNNVYLAAAHRSAGSPGGVQFYGYAGPEADRWIIGNWTYWGQAANAHSHCLLRAWWDQSESSIQCSWRDDALNWYVIKNQGSVTFSVDPKVQIFLEQAFTHTSASTFPVTCQVETLAATASSFIDPDDTAPTVSSMIISSLGTTLTITMDENIAGTPAGFVLTVNSIVKEMTNGAISGDKITFTVPLVNVGDTVQLAYSGTDIVDTSPQANELVAFSATGVTNNSRRIDSGYAARNSLYGTFGYRRR